MIRILKNYTLPIAILIGILFHKYVGILSPTAPYLLFIMLLLTFSKVSFKELKITGLHISLLTVQVIGAIIVYIPLSRWNPLVAQGTLVCIISPTAASAAVITNKLGGNVANIATFTLISSIAIGFIIPLLFPFISETAANMNFIEAFVYIIKKTFPLLILPFLLAQFFRYVIPKINKKIMACSGASFYIWAFALTVLIGETIESIIHCDAPIETIVWLGIMSFLSCISLFFIGKYMGRKSQQVISSGQCLGQKNTILAMWLCHTYLNPITSIGPGMYVICQNTFNSWQLWRKAKGEL